MMRAIHYDGGTRDRLLDQLARDGLAPTHHRMVELTGKNRKVLEIGCATGYVSALLKANGCRVIGIELDPISVRQARTICDSVIEGDAGDPSVLKSAGGDFDVILCGDVLEHLIEPRDALRTLATMLAPGGEILVSIPNVAFWRMRLRLLLGQFDYTDSGILDRTHLRFFTVDSFKKLTTEVGYQVEMVAMNDFGIPMGARLRRLPVIGSVLRRIEFHLAGTWPNLLVLHAIYRLKPDHSVDGDH